MLRTLRPLRMVKYNKSLRRAVDAFLRSLPGVTHVTVLGKLSVRCDTLHKAIELTSGPITLSHAACRTTALSHAACRTTAR